MVNKTQFYKTKVALAVVLSLGLAACGGGDDSTATSNANSSTDATQNTVGNQTELSGTVQGVVVDTNGNPIEGAAVYLGAAETVTNAGGQYVFTNVAVTSVAGVNNEGDENDDGIADSLVVTIVGTDAYLGALVTVTPEAQVNNTGGQGEDQNGGNSDVTAQTFIDGFTAEAEIAVLPMLNAGAYGYIRDCKTGQPLLDTADILSLDFLTINADADSDIDSDQITNAEDTHTISSDAEGMFSLTGLAANSSYRVSAKKGWEITSDSDEVEEDDTFTTDSEGSSTFLATIEVCPVKFTDEDKRKAPFIKSIDGQIGTTTVGSVGEDTLFDGDDDVDAEFAALNQNVVNDFVIKFSEEMASVFDLSEARVKVMGPDDSDFATVADATVTLSADGKSATVTFVTDLEEGTKVDVWFPHWTAVDANDDYFIVDNDDIKFDVVGLSTDTKASYTHAYFCTFEKPSDEGSASLGEQIIDEVAGEDGPTAEAEELAEYSSAFADNIDGDDHNGLALSQLNGDDNTAERLIALGNAITGNTALTSEFDYNLAVVDYATTGGTPVWSVTPDDTTAATTTRSAFAEFDGAEHGDVITLTPTNGFGDVLTADVQSVTLLDAIAPTAVLQESYAITSSTGPEAGGSLTVTSDTFNARFGNGGEISSPDTGVQATVGNPVIYIQPRHLAGQGERNEEFDALSADMSGRLSADDITNGAVALDVTQTTINDGVNTADFPLYDADAIAAWAAVPAEIGVAFSENVKAAAGTPSYTGTTGLVSNFVVNNDVEDNVDDGTVDVDLVDFDTTDVMALANDDAGAMIGFEGAFSDTVDNVITEASNANVMLQDAMPPMVTAARWTGPELEITFNEVVDIDAATTIQLWDPTNPTTGAGNTLVVAINPAALAGTATAFVQSGNTITVTLSTTDSTAITSLFEDGATGEFLYEEDGDAVQEEQHMILSWDNISDATGNNWADFTPAVTGTTGGIEDADTAIPNRWEVVAPRFLAYNDVGPYTVTTSFANLDTAPATDADGFTAVITLSHRISVGGTVAPLNNTQDIEVADGDNDGVFFENVADVNAYFFLDLDGTGTVETDFPAGTTAALIHTANNSRIEIVVPAGINIISGTTRIVADPAVDNNTDGLNTVDSSITGQKRVIDVVVTN